MSKIIDAHCHIYPEKIAQRAVAGTDAFYAMHSKYSGTAAGLIALGDQVGVDRFVVQSVATTPAQVASINRFIAREVEAYPDRFTGLGTLHPESMDLKGDVEHLLELGLKGVKLHPDIQQFKLDDYRCLKIYEICEQKKLPILTHTGDYRFDYSNPNRMLPILKIYSGLTFVGAHFGGWSVWDEAAEKLSDYPNFYVDCSSTFYEKNDEEIMKLIRLYGADHVLFGTDHPMWDMEEEIRRVKNLPLSEEEREWIFHKNAEKVYGIPG